MRMSEGERAIAAALQQNRELQSEIRQTCLGLKPDTVPAALADEIDGLMASLLEKEKRSVAALRNARMRRRAITAAKFTPAVSISVTVVAHYLLHSASLANTVAAASAAWSTLTAVWTAWVIVRDRSTRTEIVSMFADGAVTVAAFLAGKRRSHVHDEWVNHISTGSSASQRGRQSVFAHQVGSPQAALA